MPTAFVFSGGGSLGSIERALVGTRQWLANGCPNAMPLVLGHRHRAPQMN